MAKFLIEANVLVLCFRPICQPVSKFTTFLVPVSTVMKGVAEIVSTQQSAKSLSFFHRLLFSLWTFWISLAFHHR
jgi:hypothetical protein